MTQDPPLYTEEELKAQLKEKKEKCLYCKIISNNCPSFKILEDNIITAILFKKPKSLGHSLIIPKEHYNTIQIIPEDILKHILIKSKEISLALKKTFDSSDVSIIIEKGVAASPQSNHIFIHLIPRYIDDNINFNLEGKELSKNEFNNQLQNIKDHFLKEAQTHL